MDNRAPLIVYLPSRLRRAAEAHVDTWEAYTDISDFLTTAVRNQLTLDQHSRVERQTHPDTGRASRDEQWQDEQGDEVGDLLRPLTVERIAAVAIEPRDDGLPFLSNRMYVFPLVARMTAWLVAEGRNDYTSWATGVSAGARQVGMMFREQDRRLRRPSSQRRSVGWPLGEDADKSRDRFTFGYLMEPDGGGPLRTLGLAALADDRVLLSERGVDMARDASPLLAEGSDEDATVAPYSRRVLQDALLQLPTEVREMARFIRVVGDGAPQEVIDAAMQEAHPEWSSALVSSHRAALVGRLRDLEVVRADGRGPQAMVYVTDEEDEYAKDVLAVDERNERTE